MKDESDIPKWVVDEGLLDDFWEGLQSATEEPNVCWPPVPKQFSDCASWHRLAAWRAGRETGLEKTGGGPRRTVIVSRWDPRSAQAVAHLANKEQAIHGKREAFPDAGTESWSFVNDQDGPDTVEIAMISEKGIPAATVERLAAFLIGMRIVHEMTAGLRF